MRFNGEISLGSIFNFMGIIGAVMVFMLNYEHRMTVQEQATVQQQSRDAGQDLALSSAIANMNASVAALSSQISALSNRIK